MRPMEPTALGYSKKMKYSYKITDESTHRHVGTVSLQTAICAALFVLLVIVLVAKVTIG